MTRHISMRVALALAALCGLSACGGARPSTPPPVAAAPITPAEPEPAQPLDGEEPEEPPPESEPALAPVRAGQYRLSLSLTCNSRETRATGKLTLSPVSGGERTGEGGGASNAVADGALLWGQTDLDLKRFLSCLGVSKGAAEPIHPGVLVEVLRWDGSLHHQVLLVSTDSVRGDVTRSAAGVAMWVDRVEGDHIGGVWSRWELMDHGDGRWEADLLRPH
jgi:hypothetical protein